MRVLVVATIAAAFLPAVAFAQTAPAGKATGKLVIGDKTFPFTVAYADRLNSFDGKPGNFLTLLVASAPVPTRAERVGWTELIHRAQAGNLVAIQVIYDPAKKRVLDARLFYVEPGANPIPMNIPVSANMGTHRLEKLSIKKDSVSGTLRTTAPDGWIGSGSPDPSGVLKEWSYSVAFTAPISQPRESH